MEEKVASLAIEHLSEAELLDWMLAIASSIRRESGRSATVPQEYAISLGRVDGHIQRLQYLLSAYRTKKYGADTVTTI